VDPDSALSVIGAQVDLSGEVDSAYAGFMKDFRIYDNARTLSDL